MSSDNKIKAVVGVEAGVKGPSPAEVRKQIAALMAQARQLAATVPEADEAEKSEITGVRYQAFIARKQMEPLEAENASAIARHLELTGLSKIKFSADEVKSFTNRFQNENRAAAKQAK